MKKEMYKKISKWKYKIIAIILTSIIYIPKVFAYSMTPNLLSVDNGELPIQHFVLNNFNWFGNPSNSYNNKWAFGYDTRNIDVSKNYDIYGTIRFDEEYMGRYTTPVINVGQNACEVYTTYRKDDVEFSQGNYGNISYVWNWLNFACKNVKLTSTEHYWVQFYFPNKIEKLKVSHLGVVETATSESISEQKQQNENLENIIQQQSQNHEEFMNSDLSEEDKQKPNDQSYQDYTESENELKDKMQQANFSDISIGIDANSSAWIWNTLTRIIQANSTVFGMFIAILSIGIIKLALGR